ncbi:MAG: isoaspartyl peptidase/L-asparaginase [Gammaproteobacteria bacterium]|nr:isoaspartyl peptidase/L-asparaginase [Gammaproteobacteria bacterium]
MFITHVNQSKAPLILVHGGAGDYNDRSELLELRRKTIIEIIEKAWPRLLQGETAMTVAQTVIEQLEAAPVFNAGLGSVLQSDGMARLSASVMDGEKQKFSGVMLVTHLSHPSKLAFALQQKEQTVLGPLGAQLLAREMGLPPDSPVSPERAQQWANHFKQTASGEGGHGTVGVVIKDLAGKLVASTSTGGWTANVPERVSDVVTVAGNYASGFAAVSCTGIGEEIVNDAVAARIESRVRDGMTVFDASQKSLEEATAQQRQYGWISLDHNGNLAMACTQEMPCAAMSGDFDVPLIGQ